MGFVADSAKRSAVGTFEASPVKLLGRLLAEPDKLVRRQKLSELGIDDDDFLEVLDKSFSACRRGVLLYPGKQELSVSFNGGKDACVVLYLWLAAVEAINLTSAQEGSEARRQSIIFFNSSDEFDEVRDFVTWVNSSLNLDVVQLEGQSFREGMEGLVGSGLRAVVMGQRRGDPWMSGVDAFSPSSEGWPAFMRINPIIDWSFSHVWMFLRAFGLPYCSLYNDGYTSLGSVASTFRNPALRRVDGTYAAAYDLTDVELERDGRISRHISEKTQTPVIPSPLLPPPADAERNSLPTDDDITCSAGILVVGDEILNGKIRDCNAHYLCAMLHSRGVCIKRIEMVPDDVHAIAEAVKKMCVACDFVFTSGGLGPTHDDVTVAGIAAAFKCRLIKDDKFFAMLSGGTTKEGKSRWSNTACQKMACVPEGASVEWPCDGNPWPILSMHNVYVFAGMPKACRDMFERVSNSGRFTGAREFACVALRLDADESDIVDALQRTVDLFPSVHIGSYPSTQEDSTGEVAGDARVCRLTVTFEAFDADIIEEARAHLKNALPDVVLAE